VTNRLSYDPANKICTSYVVLGTSRH
jgi:hypothetical protein